MRRIPAMGMDSKEFSVDDDALVTGTVIIDGRGTVISLEADIWTALGEICRREQRPVNDVCVAVFNIKTDLMTLNAAMRSFVINYFRSAATEEGHRHAGHGHDQPDLCQVH